MSRTRGAGSQRNNNSARQRGEHTVEPKAKPKSTVRERRRLDAHEGAEATTDSLQLFLNQAARYPLLTAAQEVDLAKRIEKGDLAAKDLLINSNLRLVIKFARRYQGFGLPLGDLVQEAMLGLIRASEKFDWRRGYKFSTYAVLWIKQSIQRGLDNTGRQVRIPAHVAQRERTVNRITTELTLELDREPTDEEVADKAKLPIEDVMVVRDLTRVTASLDQPVGEDSDTTLGDMRAEGTELLEEEVLQREQEQTVESALDRLPELEAKVIRARFGTGGRPALSLRDTARDVGVTQNEARRLEARALELLAGDDSLGRVA